ncbi:MAG: hypothetical protein AB1724_13210 [Thermodesulfobacteriota bacterium]
MKALTPVAGRRPDAGFPGGLFFDSRDHYIVRMVNDMMTAEKVHSHTQRRFFHDFHPRGIKEMAETQGLRIAYAVIHLLESLESGQIEHRLNALRALRDEVMCSTNQDLQINTGRVLIEIMKDLVRAHGNYPRQLELAHDFRLTATGKPRIVRECLRKYHLLEMPEEWNQLAFDDHVHDANTKGRKSATHLIMDAWIKGIRRLRVIYYNFIRPETAAELLEAAAVMGIVVRIGIEYSARFHDRFAQIIWVPRGFAGAHDFLKFLDTPPVRSLMGEGRQVSEFQRRHVMAMLDHFNRRHRPDINRDLGIDLPPLEESDFSAFVGMGQASLLHLAKFIHIRLLPLMQEKAARLREQYADADEAGRRKIAIRINRMDEMDTDLLHDLYLEPGDNPEVPDAGRPDAPDLPPLMRLAPCELVDRLAQIHSGYRFTLNLSNMKAHDVLELVYECRGRISRLEIFNLKDYANGKVDHIPLIARLQEILNSGNVIQLKQMILRMIEELKQSRDPLDHSRIGKFIGILSDLETLQNMYRVRELKPRVGSDSTGQSPRLHGMGLVVMDSLPKRARKAAVEGGESPRLVIPFRVETHLRISYLPVPATGPLSALLLKVIRAVPGCGHLGMQRRREWYAREGSVKMVPDGNIVTLGGLQPYNANRISLRQPEAEVYRPRLRWRYLQTHLKNALKITFGFIPAFLTFFLAHDWWVLSFFGAFIWFGITGLRNVIQMVLGGGGLKRSRLLRWNDYISWERLTDSLFFTGFSVPLLDYFVKTLLLNQGFGITTATHPVLLYAVMAMVNGVYLTSHNLFRGLPPEAAFANFFRSLLSIPVAFGLNQLVGGVMGFCGAAAVDATLQQWAAVISKAASDVVAGFIEGTVDRTRNIRHRVSDYQKKFRQFLDVYAHLEILFPEKDVFELLDSPLEWFKSADEEARHSITILIINALDLLYFWMYQPRARTAFNKLFCAMDPDQRRILVKAQKVLTMEREISQLLLDGVLGRNFSRPLAFYLDNSPEYLAAVERLDEMLSDRAPDDVGSCRLNGSISGSGPAAGRLWEKS